MGQVEAKELARWFDAHASGMVLYARQWLAGPESEDLVQEVFVRLAALESPPENVRAWLLTCVRNGALDVLKTGRRRKARDERAGVMRARLLESRRETGIDATEASEAVAQLPAEEREVVTLRLWSGATFEEAAAIMGAPLSSVYARYRSALERLRARWELPCRKS